MLRIILVLFSLIKIFAYENFTSYWKLELKNSFPYRFQFCSNGSLVYSNNNNNNMFRIDSNTSEPVLIFSKIFTEKEIKCVRGFYIDNEDNYYLLDQGKETDTNKTPKIIFIPQNITEDNKVTVYNIKPKSIDLTKSLLTDIVVEHSGEYAYIVDSGNNNHGIIVVNLKLTNEQENAYKILNNQAPFNSNKNIRRLTEGKRELYKFSDLPKKDYIIRLSCNDDTLYYLSKGDTKIYSVSTSEIKSAIKNYKNQGVLGKINVYSAVKGFYIHNFLISSRNNMFILNNDKRYVEVSFNIDKDLSNYNIVNTTKMYFPESIQDNFYSIDTYNGNLYILNNLEEKAPYFLYKAEIKKEEYNSNIGCSVFIFKISGANIFIFVYFFLVLVLTIIIIIANSGNALEKSKIKKDEAKKANIEELNKNLNE